MSKAKNSKTGTSRAATSRKPANVRLLRIIDGDTVEIQQTGLFTSRPKERIRLWGMDAPESSQKGGTEATTYLARLTKGRSNIWLTRMAIDQYGRTVGIIHPRKETTSDAYNLRMVEGGHAHTYMLSGGEASTYRAAEAKAKEERKGLWATRHQEHPRHYRAREKSKARAAGRLKLILALAAAAAIAAALLLLNFSGISLDLLNVDLLPLNLLAGDMINTVQDLWESVKDRLPLLALPAR